MVLSRELLHWLVVSYSIALWSGVAAFTSWDWPWDIHFCNNILFRFYLVCIVFVCILSKRLNELSLVFILLCRVTILANNRCGGRHLVLTLFCYQFCYMHLSHMKILMSFLFSKCNDFYFYKCFMFFCPVKRKLAIFSHLINLFFFFFFPKRTEEEANWGLSMYEFGASWCCGTIFVGYLKTSTLFQRTTEMVRYMSTLVGKIFITLVSII